MSRLLLWITAIAIALLFPRWYVGLVLIFWLLCTTPSDAIRLPRWVSELLILAGTLGCQLHQHRVGTLLHLAIVMLMLLILRLWGPSAWWTVLYAWFPA